MCKIFLFVNSITNRVLLGKSVCRQNIKIDLPKSLNIKGLFLIYYFSNQWKWKINLCLILCNMFCNVSNNPEILKCSSYLMAIIYIMDI